MATTPPPLRIAIGQLHMCWTGDENTRAILDAISQAAAARARLCVFPELAVTGFHRQIVAQAQPQAVARWLGMIADACAAHSVAAAVGAPTFADGGRVCNSQVLIDEHGACVGSVEKHGLTPAEATFFARGSTRPVLDLLGQRCSAVLCREVEDLAEIAAQLAPGATDLVFWPGAMRPAVDTPDADPDAHVKQAQALARHLRTHIVQANWPNSLNYPEQGLDAGQSVVVAPDGTVVLRLPRARAGIAVFDLGEPSYAWHPRDG